MKAPKDLIRIHFDDSGNFEESVSGRYFLDPGNGSSIDLSAVLTLGCHVDTVRQLYTGVLVPRSRRCSRPRNWSTSLDDNGIPDGYGATPATSSSCGTQTSVLSC